MDDLDSQFILTVPAVWSDKAKNTTLTATVDAGVDMKHISLVSELEAAALYTLRAIQPNTVAANDVFTVCDAEGGTVDLISYKIKTLEPLVLVEVAEGTVCGLLLLDTAITYWQERVKPNFTGQFGDEFGAADDPSVPIEDGEDAEGIFEPIIGQIEDLTAQQLSAVGERGFHVQNVILVGGFGASEYLYHRLMKRNPGVTIMQPPNGSCQWCCSSWSGGKQGRVSHRAPSLWVTYCTPFYPWEHKEDDPYKRWDALEEIYVVNYNQSSKIAEQQPIKIPFYRPIEGRPPGLLVFEDVLYFCNDEVAPDVRNRKVMQLCKLETDLRKIPQELFRRKRNSQGVEYFVVPYILSMTPISASLLFELEFNGVSYGSVRTRY
ncbi:Hsp70 family protein [Aspergillus foveolatus]|uniref:Hsp70 family protein n=1 Tax=Aspergillus foveolatus TaxID=210207 RepID=UPI003CCDB46A